MTTKKTKVLVVDIQKKLLYDSEISGYEDIVKLLDCEWLDVVERKLNQQEGYFTIYVDDIGKLVGKHISAVSPTTGEYLVGNILISLTNDEGEPVSLTDEQMNDIIFKSTVSVIDENDGDIYPLLILE